MPVRLRRLSRRAPIVASLAVAAFLAIPVAGAGAGIVAPESGGGTPNAEGIRSLDLLIGVLALIVFFGVCGLLIYTLTKYRASKGGVASQIHGNNRLEVGWTVGAALILVLISVVTFIKLGGIYEPPSSDARSLPLTSKVVPAANGRQKLPANGRVYQIDVNGLQYVWRYTYPDGDTNNLNNVFSYEEMVVPTGATVALRIYAQDVQHSWWIPKLGGKFDAVPGYVNYTWFNIKEPGVYKGQCAELCGRNHANMVAQVRALPPAQFKAWYAAQRAEIRNADEQAARARNAAIKASAGK
ncbi:MAG: cytochrome c oxidase subunit II [Solirubrobacterales bacterium]